MSPDPLANRPTDVLRTLVFTALFLPATAFFALASMAVAPVGPVLLRPVVRCWSGSHRLLARVILGIRVRIEGTLPDEGVIVAMKHESMFEAVDIPFLMRWPAPFPKAELVRIPVWGWALRRYGAVVVERGEGAKALRAMIAASKQRVSDGRPLVIFPEGTRVPVNTVAPLQAGFAGIYKLLGLPVVPVAVDSGRLYHRRWKRPGVITLRVGERIEPGLKREEIESRVIAAINALQPEGQPEGGA